MAESPARDRQVSARRVWRARRWLGLAFFLHCGLIVHVASAVGTGSVRPLVPAVTASVFVAVPLAVLYVWERRSPSARRPSCWAGRGSFVAVLHGVGVGIAFAGPLRTAGFSTWGAVSSVAASVVVVELVPVLLAARGLRRPLSRDLGEADVEIRVKIRPPERWMPSWMSQHDVRLTDEHLIVMVRPGPTWGYAKYVPLSDVRGVEVRRTDERDASWFSAEDGFVLPPAPGDAVVVHHRTGVQLLPVRDAAGFAEVLAGRIDTLF
jgi:hypothetical protein